MSEQQGRDKIVKVSPFENFAEPEYEHPLFSIGIPKDFKNNPVWNSLVQIDKF
jgi:hypothetical protein